MIQTRETKALKANDKLEYLTKKNETIRQNKIDVYNQFLTELFIELDEGPKKLSLVNRCREVNLPTWLPKILVNLNILTKIGTGINTEYDWTNSSVEPNDEMAELVLDTYEKAAKGSNRKVKERKEQERKLKEHRKNGLVPIDKDKLVEDHLSENEVDKLERIGKFLEHGYVSLDGAFDPISAYKIGFKAKMKELGLSSVILTSAINLGILKKFGDGGGTKYLWGGPKPSITLCHQLFEAEKNYVKGITVEIEKPKVEITKKPKVKIEKPIIQDIKEPIKAKPEVLTTQVSESIPNVQLMIKLAKKLIKFNEYETALGVLETIKE